MQELNCCCKKDLHSKTLNHLCVTTAKHHACNTAFARGRVTPTPGSTPLLLLLTSPKKDATTDPTAKPVQRVEAVETTTAKQETVEDDVRAFGILDEAATVTHQSRRHFPKQVKQCQPKTTSRGSRKHQEGK